MIYTQQGDAFEENELLIHQIAWLSRAINSGYTPPPPLSVYIARL